MLQSLHNKSTSVFAKGLLFVLVASFALWGVSDLFMGRTSNTLVTVGSSAITAPEFRSAIANEQANYRRILGNKYSTELLHSFGIPQQVLQKLVNQKLIQEETSELGISVPEHYLLDKLANEAAFQTDTGQFDRASFASLLSHSGLTEEQFVKMLEEDMLADMLQQAAFSGLTVAREAVELSYIYNNESRTVDVLYFPGTLIDEEAVPSQIELERYYEANAERFKAMEYRTISAVTLQISDLVDSITIDNSELLTEYQQHAEEYRTPEKREVEQLLFASAGEAENAYDSLQSGKSFYDIPKTFNVMNEKLPLGVVAASDIPTETSGIVFSLAKGEVSAPVESGFGWHIFKVNKIIPEQLAEFETVKGELAERLKNEKAQEDIYKLSNDLQDALAGGLTLEQAAESISVPVTVYGPIDAAGKTPDGTKRLLPTGMETAVADIFQTEEGVTSDVHESSDHAYFAFRVDSIIPERTRALDEIRGIVTQKWQEDEKAKRLETLAKETVEQLKSTPIEEAAKTSGAELLSGQEMERTTTHLESEHLLPPALTEQVFSLKRGETTDVYPMRSGGYIVAKLRSIQYPAIQEESFSSNMQTLQQALLSSYKEEFEQYYMQYLFKKHKVSPVDEALMKELL